MKSSISIKEIQSGIISVAVQGSFTLDNLDQVEEALNEALEKGPSILALDCSAMDYLDSSAIGSLVKFFNKTVNRKIRMILLDLNEEVLRVLKLIRLEKFFVIKTRTEFEREFISG